MARHHETDSRDKYVINLEKDGLPCIPVLGRNTFGKVHAATAFHTHESCIEIILANRGELVYESCGEKFPFRPGRVFISRPDEPHRMLTYPKGLVTYYLLFRIPHPKQRILNLSLAETKWLTQSLFHAPERLFDSNTTIRHAFIQLLSLYNTLPVGSPERSLRLRQTATDLLIAIALAARTPPRITSNENIERIIRYIRTHPEENHAVSSLAERAALAPSVLTSRFRHVTGLPPHAFILSCRMEAAKSALANTRRRISEIADSLGFPSSQHFATLFKKTTGLTPRMWRASSQPKRE